MVLIILLIIGYIAIGFIFACGYIFLNVREWGKMYTLDDNEYESLALFVLAWPIVTILGGMAGIFWLFKLAFQGIFEQFQKIVTNYEEKRKEQAKNKANKDKQS